MTDPATLVSLAQNVTDLVAAKNTADATAAVSAAVAANDAAADKVALATLHVAAKQLLAAIEAADPTLLEPTPPAGNLGLVAPPPPVDPNPQP